jgi:hypothetical protein
MIKTKLLCIGCNQFQILWYIIPEFLAFVEFLCAPATEKFREMTVTVSASYQTNVRKAFLDCEQWQTRH